jgi:hypothetical protein
MKNLERIIQFLLEYKMNEKTGYNIHIQHAPDLDVTTSHCSDNGITYKGHPYYSIFNDILKTYESDFIYHVKNSQEIDWEGYLITPILGYIIKINLLFIDYGTNNGLDWNYSIIGMINLPNVDYIAKNHNLVEKIVQQIYSDESIWKRNKREKNKLEIHPYKNIFGREIQPTKGLRKRKSKAKPIPNLS